jgi:ABC-2 type transport system permease protein
MVRKAVRDLRWTTFWYAFGMALFIFLMTSFYPTLERQQEQFVELLQ